MKPIIYCAFLTLIVLLATGTPIIASDMPLHLALAEDMVNTIRSEDNQYSYHDNFIQWQDAANPRFINNTDCSNFFNLLIERVYGISANQLKMWTDHKEPTARRWYDAIIAHKTAGLLLPLASLADARPGDIIFIKYEADNKDTGHIMIIAGMPQHHAASEPLVSGTEQWEVPVIDSSKSGHGHGDTRYISEKNFHQGVGKGILRLYSDAAGIVAGYSWSLSTKSDFKSVSEHPVILARLQVTNSR